jgi:hypothetical protein
MKKYLLIPIMLFFSSGILAQGIYNNGGKMVIGAGACVYIAGNYQNETNVTDGSIDLSGTLKIEGNYTNNVAGSDILSTVTPGSEVVFNGSTGQTIGGSTAAVFTFPKLTINKSSNDITLLKEIRVNDSMRFISGKVDIGSNNLTFGPSAIVAGNPSGSSMIVATGIGQVKKEYSGLNAFTFPVGDINVIGEYSPVTLNFTAATFAPGAFVGLNLVNSQYIDPAITGSYLNRYWNITQTGISSFACDATFQYLPADVTGTESSIICLRVVPTPFTTFSPANTGLHQLSAIGLTSFGTFTGGPGITTDITLNLKLYLEGFYIGGGLMRQAQGVAGNQFPGNTVDQITVELHDQTTYLTQVYSANNINLSTSGLASMTIPGTFNGSYYVTVKHRNSIATVSASPVAFSSQIINYDFTTANTQAFGNNLKNMAPGIFAFYGGDENSDGVVDGIDLIDIENNVTAFSTGYVLTDLNGDGVVDGFDLILAENNAFNFVTAIHP